MNDITMRKQLRDIRVGEMLVFDDSACPWAIIEGIELFPDGLPNAEKNRAVLLTRADGRIDWAPMRLDGWWDVAA